MSLLESFLNTTEVKENNFKETTFENLESDLENEAPPAKLQLCFDFNEFDFEKWREYFYKPWTEKKQETLKDEVYVSKVAHKARYNYFAYLLPDLIFIQLKQKITNYIEKNDEENFISLCEGLAKCQLSNNFSDLLRKIGYNIDDLEITEKSSVNLGGEYYMINLREDSYLWDLIHNDKCRNQLELYKNVKLEENDLIKLDENNHRILNLKVNDMKDDSFDSDCEDNLEPVNECIRKKIKKTRRIGLPSRIREEAFGFNFCKNRKEIRLLGVSANELKNTDFYRHQKGVVIKAIKKNLKIEESSKKYCLDINFLYGAFGSGILKIRVDLFEKDKLEIFDEKLKNQENIVPDVTTKMWILCMARKGTHKEQEKPKIETENIFPLTHMIKKRRIDDRQINLVQVLETKKLRDIFNTTSVGKKYDDAYDPHSRSIIWLSQSSDIRSDVCCKNTFFNPLVKICSEFNERLADVYLAVKSQDTKNEWQLLKKPRQIKLNQLATLKMQFGEKTYLTQKKNSKYSRYQVHKRGNTGPLCEKNRNLSDYNIEEGIYDGIDQNEIDQLKHENRLYLNERKQIDSSHESKFTPNDCCIYCGWQTASLYITFPDKAKEQCENVFLGKKR